LLNFADNAHCGVHFTDGQYSIDDAGHVTIEWVGTGPNKEEGIMEFECQLNDGEPMKCKHINSDEY